jgi:glycosyltransferase involved in cell wall biosynthesis
VSFDDDAAFAARLAALAADPVRRTALGGAGRRRIEEHYAADGLAARLLATYRSIAGRTGHAGLRRALAS